MNLLINSGWRKRASAEIWPVLSALLLAAAAGRCAQGSGARQPPAALPERVTLAQFEQFLAQPGHPRDAKFAAQIAGFELTERAGSARLAHWVEEFPGKKTRAALTAVGDLSAFAQFPAADLRSAPAPDAKTASQIFSRAVDYVVKTRPRLPNFSALRSTTRFEIGPRDEVFHEQQALRLFTNAAERPVYESLGRAGAGPDGGEWLFLAARSEMPVSYRDGLEVSESERLGTGQLGGPGAQLSTTGEFGPILSVVVRDAVRGKVEWGRWETGQGQPVAGQRVAVFRYSVPSALSNYAVSDSASGQPTFPAYHGEIAVDPTSGAILRIVVLADADAGDAAETAIAVDYGPVEIAGKTYLCPVRSIALARGWRSQGGGAAELHTFLNDVEFTRYHVFRTEMRIVPDGGAAP